MICVNTLIFRCVHFSYPILAIMRVIFQIAIHRTPATAQQLVGNPAQATLCALAQRNHRSQRIVSESEIPVHAKALLHVGFD